MRSPDVPNHDKQILLQTSLEYSAHAHKYQTRWDTEKELGRADFFTYSFLPSLGFIIPLFIYLDIFCSQSFTPDVSSFSPSLPSKHFFYISSSLSSTSTFICIIFIGLLREN